MSSYFTLKIIIYKYWIILFKLIKMLAYLLIFSPSKSSFIYNYLITLSTKWSPRKVYEQKWNLIIKYFKRSLWGRKTVILFQSNIYNQKFFHTRSSIVTKNYLKLLINCNSKVFLQFNFHVGYDWRFLIISSFKNRNKILITKTDRL